MKKVFLMMLAVTAISLVSCGGKTGATSGSASGEDSVEVSSEESAEEVSFEGGTTYQNAKFGYSIALPAGFHEQNSDKEMEESRGGKVFINNANMIDVTAEDKSAAVLTPEEFAKQDADMFTVDEASGEKLISKDLKGCTMIAKWIDDSGYYRALCYAHIGKVLYSISASYSKESQKDFEEQIDKVIASLKTKQ